ncbi:MAG: Cof-type HAD-IIB family hydrolase [Anaerolineae bacterium]|nr:Cof-type HAD-IIB family hydrolase [Anaerolineae bacterium]
MSNYKLLILDVDGTLVGHGAYPSARVVEAITAAREKGVQVALGTGRASEACYHILRELNLDGLHVFFDGAAVVDWPSNDIVFLQALPPHAGKRLVQLSREHDLFLEIYAHDFYFIEKDNALAQQQRDKLQINSLVTNLMSLTDRIKIVKGQLLATTEAEKARVEQLSEEMARHCKMSWSFDASNGIFFINAVARSVSKGQALRDMMDYLNIDAGQVLAMGDSFNDLATFETVGFSVAMGNAPPEVKRKAGWVAPSVDDDGVAVAIERFVLNT